MGQVFEKAKFRTNSSDPQPSKKRAGSRGVLRKFDGLPRVSMMYIKNMQVSDERINLWARPISETEEEKCQNALSQVTNAIKNYFGDDVLIVKQGSHRNRTNIRADSDVDIAIVHQNYYFPDISALSEADKVRYQQNFTAATYEFNEFKTDVHAVLQDVFGIDSVDRKNKCIRIKGNTYRVNADVVPAYGCVLYKAFDNIEAEGIAFLTDRSQVRVVSFPDHHYENGVAKNTATSHGFKAVVRILKNVRNELIESKIMGVDSMSSHFIECLVWNVPNKHFSGDSNRAMAQEVVEKIWNDMRDPEKSKDYSEVSDLHWLLRGVTRTPAQAEVFMLKAWEYLKS
jgi:hypothetical protein